MLCSKCQVIVMRNALAYGGKMKRKAFVCVLIVMVLFVFGCTGVHAAEPAANGGYTLNTIQEKLNMEDAYETLNWFYYEENSSEVWQVKIRPEDNCFTEYQNCYRMSKEGKREYYMSFSSYYPEIGYKGFVQLMICENSPEHLEAMAVYKNYCIFSSDNDSMIYMVTPLEDGNYIWICFQKEHKGDGWKQYETYLYTLIDTILVEKMDKCQLEGTSYLKLYELGWSSEGGGHLYLDSQKVSLDEQLTLDLSGYSVADFNRDITYAQPADSCEYAIRVMDDTFVNGSYFYFPILYVSNANDTYYASELTADKYKMSEKKLNGISFEVYTEKEEYGNCYYKYATEDGYFLFQKCSDDFESHLRDIIL